jgi:RasGEF domain
MVRFIKIARELLELNNFTGVFEICSGLQSAAVYRLKKAWDLVRAKDAKEMAFYENELIAQVTSTSGNFAAYRERLHSSNPPIIPYLGVYQTDLTFIDDGNPDTLGSDVNFFKRRLMAEVIKEVQSFQQKPYNLLPVASVRDWLHTQETDVWPFLDETGIYEASLEVEPREGSEAAAAAAAPTTRPESHGTVRAFGFRKRTKTSLPAPSLSSSKLNKFFGVGGSTDLPDVADADSASTGSNGSEENRQSSSAPGRYRSRTDLLPPREPLRRSSSAETTNPPANGQARPIDPFEVAADGPAFSPLAANVPISVLLQNDEWL